MKPALSILIPTRERAEYLRHSIATCLDNPGDDFEVIVLDNASVDDTAKIVRGIDDCRLRHEPSDRRLSMRANFERGLDLARGSVLCFIGDDDGIFSNTVARALSLFEAHEVDAVSAARAHYFWPDLLASRRNTALLPRGIGTSILDSREQLRGLLFDNDYYRLPCLYHGFISRKVVERVRKRQGLFFVSSQVDIYSAIALSMESIRYVMTREPLVINGGSKRSNGASHFGGGDSKERELWKTEDDIRFFPGFEQSATVGHLILESALRYCEAHGGLDIEEVFERGDIVRALGREQARRAKLGRPASEIDPALQRLGVSLRELEMSSTGASPRMLMLVQSFLRSCPIDMRRTGVADIHGAAHVLTGMAHRGDHRFFSAPIRQLATAMRIARG